MASPQEIEETLSLIRKAWGKAPMLRLNQLLSSAASKEAWHDPDLFYIEDKVMNRGLKKFIKEVKVV